MLFVIAGAFVLVPSGIAKVRDPTPTSRALRTARLPSSLWMVRVLGFVEIAAAALALATDARPGAIPLGLLYSCFAAFIFYALAKRLPLASCGCFGRTDTPPNRGHAVITVVIASQAFIAAINGSDRSTSAAVWIGAAVFAVATVYVFTRSGTRPVRS